MELIPFPELVCTMVNFVLDNPDHECPRKCSGRTQRKVTRGATTSTRAIPLTEDTSTDAVRIKLMYRIFTQNNKDVPQRNFLWYIVMENDVALLEYLIRHWRTYVETESWQYQMSLSLFFAQSVSIASILIDHSAEIDYQADCLTTPLFAYIRDNRIELVLFMIFKLANVNICTHTTPSAFSNTPLTLAVVCSHFHLCEYLLDAGADVNACTEDGDTALHIAVRNDKPILVGLLLHAGADPLRSNNKRYRPRHMCMSQEMEGVFCRYKIPRQTDGGNDTYTSPC